MALELSQFYGTEQWYRHQSGMLYTDGIKYVAEEAGAYWLIDAIASHQLKLTSNELQEFQLWELAVNPDKTAVLTCKADSNRKPVITQKLEYTDFPENIKIYVENRVILLPSEH